MLKCRMTKTIWPPRLPRVLLGRRYLIQSVLAMSGDIASNWKRFIRQWKSYETAARLRTESKEFRRATFFMCIGPDALEMSDRLPFESEKQTTDIDLVLATFEAFCIGSTSEIYECYKFNQRVQEEGESIDAFVAALRNLAKSCNYTPFTDSLIRDRIVIRVRDDSVRKKLLQATS